MAFYPYCSIKKYLWRWDLPFFFLFEIIHFLNRVVYTLINAALCMYKNWIQPLECCLVITCLDMMQIYASSSILISVYLLLFLTNTMSDGLLFGHENFFIKYIYPTRWFSTGWVVFFFIVLHDVCFKILKKLPPIHS